MKRKRLKIFSIIILIPAFVSFFLTCSPDPNIESNKNSQKESETLIKVGNYEFTNSDLLRLSPNSVFNLLSEKQSTEIVKSAISTGLLLERAKKLGYEQNDEVKKKVWYYRNKLSANLARKYNSLDTNKSHSQATYYQSNFYIDYVWIPQTQSKMAKEIHKVLEGHITTEVFLNRKEIEKWKTGGMKLYKNVLISDILPHDKDVITKVQNLKYGKIDFIKSDSGFYIIMPIGEIQGNNQNIQHFIKEKTRISYEELLFNSIQGDKNVLNVIFPPLGIMDNNHTDSIIAKINARSISKKEFFYEITKLPQTVQALFRNLSTRIKATSTLIMLLNGSKPKSLVERRIESLQRKQYVDKLIFEEINRSNSKDTLTIIMDWLKKISNDSLSPISQSDIDRIINKESKFDHDYSVYNQYKEIYSIQKQYGELKNNEFYPWLYPELFDNLSEIKLNYQLLEDIIIPETNDNKYKVLVIKQNKSYTIHDIEERLSKLTGKTRSEICEKKNYVRLLKNLVLEPGEVETANIKINNNLIPYVNFLGNELTSKENYIKSSSIITEINKTQFTLHDIRLILDSLPENELKVFWVNDETRIKPIKELLIDLYWKKKNGKNLTFQQDNIINDIETYKNKSILEIFYKNEIQGNNIDIIDQKTNFQVNKALNKYRDNLLKRHISIASRETPIYVSKIIHKYLSFSQDEIEFELNWID